jgi:hypothetical protein
MRDRRAGPELTRVAGMAMTVVETLRKPVPATIGRNVPRSFAAMRPDSAISRWQQTDLVPARSRSGPAQQQATRRFLASIDRVRGAAIQAR